jgi:hypothetical protein
VDEILVGWEFKPLSLRPMPSAPRDGTVIVAYHKATREPMPVQIWSEDETVKGVIDFRGLWSFWPSERRPGYRQGYVREEHLMGWVGLPQIDVGGRAQ